MILFSDYQRSTKTVIKPSIVFKMCKMYKIAHQSNRIQRWRHILHQRLQLHHIAETITLGMIANWPWLHINIVIVYTYNFNLSDSELFLLDFVLLSLCSTDRLSKQSSPSTVSSSTHDGGGSGNDASITSEKQVHVLMSF